MAIKVDAHTVLEFMPPSVYLHMKMGKNIQTNRFGLNQIINIKNRRINLFNLYSIRMLIHIN